MTASSQGRIKAKAFAGTTPSVAEGPASRYR